MSSPEWREFEITILGKQLLYLLGVITCELDKSYHTEIVKERIIMHSTTLLCFSGELFANIFLIVLRSVANEEREWCEDLLHYSSLLLNILLYSLSLHRCINDFHCSKKCYSSSHITHPRNCDGFALPPLTYWKWVPSEIVCIQRIFENRNVLFSKNWFTDTTTWISAMP